MNRPTAGLEAAQSTAITREPEASCGTCNWYRQAIGPDNQLVMVCRRRPPIAIAVPVGPGRISVASIFPPIASPDEFCGDWQAGKGLLQS